MFGTLPAAEETFYAIKPIVVALIANALRRLVPEAVTDFATGGIFFGGLILGLFGINELLIMALGALAGMLLFSDRLRAGIAPVLVLVPPALPAVTGHLGEHR